MINELGSYEISSSDVLRRTFEVTPENPPIIDRVYATNERMQAERIKIVFIRRNDGPWSVDDAHVYGRRVLKNGNLGEPRSDRMPSYLTRQEKPSWLDPLVAELRPKDSEHTEREENR